MTHTGRELSRDAAPRAHPAHKTSLTNELNSLTLDYLFDAGSGGQEARPIEVGMAGLGLVRKRRYGRVGRRPPGGQIPG